VRAILASAAFVLVAAPAAAQTPAPDTALKYFAGTWTCNGHFVKNGASISSTIAPTWDDATQTLLVHHDDSAPFKYHSLELWGPTKAHDAYRASIGDAFSGIRRFDSPGWENATLNWTRTADGKPVERFAYTRKGDAEMTVDWLVAGADGAFALGDTLDCRKANSGG
jgi:hypothetical protein